MKAGLLWSEDEDHFLKTNISALGSEGVGKRLGRSTGACKDRARRLGCSTKIFAKPRHLREWRPKDGKITGEPFSVMRTNPAKRPPLKGKELLAYLSKLPPEDLTAQEASKLHQYDLIRAGYIYGARAPAAACVEG